MTEKAPEPHVEEDDDELDGKLNYKPPPTEVPEGAAGDGQR